MYGGDASVEVLAHLAFTFAHIMRFTYSSRMSKEVRSHGLDVALIRRGEFANCFEIFLR